MQITSFCLNYFRNLVVLLKIVEQKMTKPLVVWVESLDSMSVVLGLNSECVHRVCVEFMVFNIEFVLFDFHVDHVQCMFGEGTKFIKGHIFPVEFLHLSA